MDYTSIITTILVGVVVIGVVVWRVSKGTVQIDSPDDALRAYWDVLRLVESYVPAADQLFAIGALKKEDRLEYVLDMVFMYVDKLDIEQVRGIIEGYIARRKELEAHA